MLHRLNYQNTDLATPSLLWASVAYDLSRSLHLWPCQIFLLSRRWTADPLYLMHGIYLYRVINKISGRLILNSFPLFRYLPNLPNQGAVGKITLGTICKKGLVAARKSGSEVASVLRGVKLTNHSARVTTVTRLREAGHDEASIMAQTGHRSAAGLCPYMREKIASAIVRADDLSIKTRPAGNAGVRDQLPLDASPAVAVETVAVGAASVPPPVVVPPAAVTPAVPPAVILSPVVDVTSVPVQPVGSDGPLVAMGVHGQAGELGTANASGRMMFGGSQMWGPYCMPTINININGRNL